jgi:hypothetical protein
MTAATEVRCRRQGCGDAWREHAPGGAHCRVPGCDCHGFSWIDPDAPPVGSYREPPQQRA